MHADATFTQAETVHDAGNVACCHIGNVLSETFPRFREYGFACTWLNIFGIICFVLKKLQKFRELQILLAFFACNCHYRFFACESWVIHCLQQQITDLTTIESFPHSAVNHSASEAMHYNRNA